jgi:hypothetical protein
MFMDNESTTYDIYHLSDPRDQSVRYVGMSKDARTRYRRHLSQKDNPLMPWFQELAEQGHKPFLTVIETVQGKQQAKERELHWINHYAAQGAYLENYQGNASNHSKWKERVKWLTYLTKEYDFIEDPQERQLVIDFYLQLYLSGDMICHDIHNAVWVVVDEIQKKHQINIGYGEVAQMLAKVFKFKLNGSDGGAA